MIESIKSKFPDFIMDEHQKEYYENMMLYFSKSEKSVYPLSKGLLISGPVGTGKTYSIQIMQKMFFGFTIIPSRFIVRDFLSEGFKAIDKYGRGSFSSGPTGNLNKEKPITYCFDDIGLEEVNSALYGNQANVMAEILLDRYDILKSHGMITYATTNRLPEELKATYRDRMYDRMREMFTLVTLTGKSKRK